MFNFPLSSILAECYTSDKINSQLAVLCSVVSHCSVAQLFFLSPCPKMFRLFQESSPGSSWPK